MTSTSPKRRADKHQAAHPATGTPASRNSSTDGPSSWVSGGAISRKRSLRMSRNRTSARKAGAAFERAVADVLAEHVDDRIDRRVKRGQNDRGDIGGLRHMGGRVIVEVKDCARLDLAGWVTEADTERGNDDALAGVVCHKRKGKGDPLDSYVTMTLRDFVALLTGARP